MPKTIRVIDSYGLKSERTIDLLWNRFLKRIHPVEKRLILSVAMLPRKTTSSNGDVFRRNWDVQIQGTNVSQGFYIIKGLGPGIGLVLHNRSGSHPVEIPRIAHRRYGHSLSFGKSSDPHGWFHGEMPISVVVLSETNSLAFISNGNATDYHGRRLSENKTADPNISLFQTPASQRFIIGCHRAGRYCTPVPLTTRAYRRNVDRRVLHIQSLDGVSNRNFMNTVISACKTAYTMSRFIEGTS